MNTQKHFYCYYRSEKLTASVDGNRDLMEKIRAKDFEILQLNEKIAIKEKEGETYLKKITQINSDFNNYKELQSDFATK